MTNETKTKKIVLIALFSTIAAILMVFDFVTPIAPSFIKFDLAELPVILGGYLLGPLNGTLIIVLKILIKLIIKQTSTLFIGEFTNLISSFFYMLPSVLIYRLNKTYKNAILSLIVGTLFASLMITIVDYYIVFPLYANLGYGMDKILAAGKAVNGNIDSLFSLMLISILPFNLFKYGITSVLTLLLYKKLKNVLKL